MFGNFGKQRRTECHQNQYQGQNIAVPDGFDPLCGVYRYHDLFFRGKTPCPFVRYFDMFGQAVGHAAGASDSTIMTSRTADDFDRDF